MRPAASSVLYHPLDEIIGSRALVRVSRVLAAHGGSLAVSDIARRSTLSLPSVRTALRRLIDLDVVTAIGAGRSMVCALRGAHSMVPPLIALYAAEREQAARLLREIRKAAMTVRPVPLAVWLYGSVARGEDDPGSDIDVALVSVSNQPSRQAERLRDAIASTVPARAGRISVVGLGARDLRGMMSARSAFWRRIERDAVVLAGDSPADVRLRFNRRGKAVE